MRVLSGWLGCAVMCIALTGCAGLSPLDYPVREDSTGAYPVGVAEPMTLPRFLGLDKVCRGTAMVVRHEREQLASFVPVLEPQPMVLPLSHPDNAEHASPAVANVHKVKKAKADAAVKVKAVAALAELDCAANPLVEEGLLAALDDEFPEVREAAAEAVLTSTRTCGGRCSGCCSPLIRAKLTHIVFDKTDECCWVEPSSRARRLARLALDACGGPLSDLEAANGCQPVPLETPYMQSMP